MGKGQRRSKLLTYLYVIIMAIFSGIFSFEVYNYVGTIKSTRSINVSADDMMIIPLEDEIQIQFNLIVLNPTSYSRVEFHYLYYQLFLVVDGAETLVGAGTKFVHGLLVPHKETFYNVTIIVPRTKNQYLSDHVLTSELHWIIKNLIHFETPIIKSYQNIDISISTKPL